MANALSEGVDFFDYLFHHLKARSKSKGPSSKRFPKALPALPAATVLAAMLGPPTLLNHYRFNALLPCLQGGFQIVTHQLIQGLEAE